jgi:hypothetical protein
VPQTRLITVGLLPTITTTTAFITSISLCSAEDTPPTCHPAFDTTAGAVAAPLPRDTAYFWYPHSFISFSRSFSGFHSMHCCSSSYFMLTVIGDFRLDLGRETLVGRKDVRRCQRKAQQRISERQVRRSFTSAWITCARSAEMDKRVGYLGRTGRKRFRRDPRVSFACESALCQRVGRLSMY